MNNTIIGVLYRHEPFTPPIWVYLSETSGRAQPIFSSLMSDSNVTVLANLFAQVGPLITRVNELKQEMEQLKAQLANCSPELGKRVGESSPPDAPFKKKFRTVEDCPFLQLPETILFRIMRALDYMSILRLSSTCRNMRFYASDELLWFPVQHRFFPHMRCRLDSRSRRERPLQRFVSRMGFDVNWRLGHVARQELDNSQQLHCRLDPIESEVLYGLSRTHLTEWRFSSGDVLSTTALQSPGVDLEVTDRRIFVACTNSATIFARDNRQVVAQIDGLLSSINRAVVRDDYYLIGLWDGGVHLYDTQGTKLDAISGHRSPVYCLDYMQSERIFASGSSDRCVKLWDHDGGQLAVLSGHQRTVTDLQADRLSRYILSASRDRTIRYWDVETNNCVSVFSGHSDSVKCIRSRNSSLFVSGGSDQKILLWDVRQPQPVHTFSEQHSGTILSLDIDERRLVSCGSDTVLIWDFSMPQPMECSL